MRKQTYLRRLRKSLTGIPVRETESLIEYYSELIDDAYERGKTSREIFRELEDPQAVANNYKRENAYKEERYSARYSEQDDIDERLQRLERLERLKQEERLARLEQAERKRMREQSVSDFDEPRSPRKEKRRRGVFYWLNAAPVRLILTILGFALGLAVLLLGLGLVLAVIAVVVACGVGGLYAIGMSFHMFTVNASIAMAQVGAGLALIGLNVALGFLIPLVCKGYGALVGWLFRGFRRSDKERFVRRSSSVGGKIATAACGFALIIGGGVLGTIGFGRLDYDYRKLAVYDDYVQTAVEFSAEDKSAVKVDCTDLSLTVKPSESDLFKITYYNSEDDQKTVTEEEGALVLKGGVRGAEGVKNYFRNAWTRGLAFSSLAHLYNSATVEVPQSYGGSLEVIVDNGPVVLAGLTLGDVKIETHNAIVKIESCTFATLTAETSNGMISADQLKSQQVSLKTFNGYITVEDSECASLNAFTSNGKIDVEETVSNTAELNAQNGAIQLDCFAVENANFKTSNGAIYGSIKGNLEDYRIQASASNGSCNLTNKDTGDRLLTAHATNGKIRIDFAQ